MKGNATEKTASADITQEQVRRLSDLLLHNQDAKTELLKSACGKNHKKAVPQPPEPESSS
jgi:hypothetical protein